MLWGCCKPNRPRLDFEKQKPRKYEHPPKEPTRAFLLAIPDYLWQKVSDRHGILITNEDRPRGFWYWVWKNNVPIVITEGAKKAGALLTAGYAAIALPGHTGGHRAIRNEYDEKLGGHRLIPDLKHFATLNRQVYICFDRDEKLETIRSVARSVSTLGYLLQQEGCKSSVIRWDTPYKGVDDLIVSLGSSAFDAAYDSAPGLDKWDVSQLSQLTYTPSLVLNQRYLGTLPVPHEARLACIKSPKGTGKTESLVDIVEKAVANNQPVLVITHRIQLGQAICQRLKIPYITEVRDSETGAKWGYGLCVDSLHPKSQANFIASQWSEALVIIDEAEQVIWHTLHSSTCQRERVSIIRSLRRLLTDVVNSHTGRIILSDADLSDVSVDFVKGLADAPNLDPWVVTNSWMPDVKWDVNNYDQKQPTAWLLALEKHIENGGKPFIVTNSQKAKSKWGTRNLEAHLKRKYPDKRILRIDSESISEVGHSAQGCIAYLNQVLTKYDIVICSPSIETGVSIDIKGHFTSVWGCFHGVTPTQSALQALARVREPIERHAWSKTYGIGKVANGSTSYKALFTSGSKLAKANIQLLREADLEDIDFQFDPIALRTWAKMAARINAGMVAYRSSITDGLINEGHNVYDYCVDNEDSSSDLDNLKAEITECRDAQYLVECEAIVTAKDITQTEYEKSRDQRAKTGAERRAERKHELKLRYTEETTINAELIKKDDDGWYSKVALHYYLTLGKPHLKARDIRRIKSSTEDSYPYAWMPDFNKTQLSAPVAVLENLGVLALADPEVEYRGSDELLENLAATCKANARDIKTALKITISERDEPIAVVQKLFSKVGLALKCVGRLGSREDRQRVYKFVAITDRRFELFAAWLKRDEALAELVEQRNSVSTPGNKDIDLTPGHKVQNSAPKTENPVPTSNDLTIGAIVQRWGWGLNRYAVEQIVNGVATLKSLATGGIFQAFVSEILPWEGAA